MPYLEVADDDCGCFEPGPGRAVECGLQVDERVPETVRRAETGNYDSEEICHCDCHQELDDAA